MEIRNKIIAEIKRIIGGRERFEFSKAYMTMHAPTIGEERVCNTVTREYVYVNCYMIIGYNNDRTECGAHIKKYPLYRNGEGRIVHKVKLEDLFTKDLEKLLDEIKFFLWWEKHVHFPKVKAEYTKVKAEYENSLKYVQIFDKMDIDTESIKDMPLS